MPYRTELLDLFTSSIKVELFSYPDLAVAAHSFVKPMYNIIY